MYAQFSLFLKAEEPWKISRLRGNLLARGLGWDLTPEVELFSCKQDSILDSLS